MEFKYPFPDKPKRYPGDDFKPEGESLTLQSESEACDINLIVARYTKTGVIEHIRQNEGAFMDLGTQLEYQEALNMVKAAEGSFAIMPAEIRARFNNNAGQFLAFAEENPDDYLQKLGIAPAPTAAAPAAAAPAAAGPAAPASAAPAAEVKK